MTSAQATPQAEFRFFERWMFRVAIPYWIEHGIDRDGLAYEEFDFDGQPRDVGYRRSLVQFRQVYVFSRAAHMGLCSRRLPCELFHRVANAAWHIDGGFVHKLDSNGRVSDDSRQSYDQAFGMLAAAWAYALDGKPETLEFAYRTLQFLDDKMASSTGGYTEEAAKARLPRRQNPHMHLLEAFLALYEITHDEVFRERAGTIVNLLDLHFVSDTGALREFFDDAWRPAEGSDGDVVEPGHHYEWVWLLHEYARLTGDPVHPLASTLFDFAERHGVDESGRPVKYIDTMGGRHSGGVKLWAVTEQLKARIARAEASSQKFDPALVSIVGDLSRDFLVVSPPIWFEEIAADGTPSRCRMPASTLYHIMLSATELLRWQSHARSPLAPMNQV